MEQEHAEQIAHLSNTRNKLVNQYNAGAIQGKQKILFTR